MNQSACSSTVRTPFLVSVIAALGLFFAAGTWLPSILALGQTANPFDSRAPGYPNWSAFTGVRWDGDRPTVQFEDQWYEPVSFHGIPVEEILKHCDENGWPKRGRFTEDLVQIVRLMGHEIDKTTTLVLRDQSGNVVTKNNVLMTEENLRKLTGSIIIAGGGDRVIPRTLTREDVLADLAEFQETLESQFAFLRANDADYVSAIAAIAEKTGDEMETAEFAAELRKVMALFIDGHAKVSPSAAGYTFGFLPFRIEPSCNRFVAVRPDRSAFLDDKLPYIRAIDGVELPRWLAAIAVDVPKGSPQYQRDRGLTQIALVQHYRGELGLEVKDTIEVEHVSRDGQTRRTSTWPVANRPALGGDWPPVRSPETLDGNIGYLRIDSMGDRSVELLREWMPKFRDTDGLIIDVRDNGGGVYTPLLELAGYLLTKEDPPRIGNVAKYRLDPRHFGTNHLSWLYLYREDSDRFDDREREAVRQFKQTFTPEWGPPIHQFSDWHYLVLAKRADDPRFDYRKPVAILMDEGCFSASDMFLGALKGWPNVTLVGQPSSGGGGDISGKGLSRSRLSVTRASKVSFQPNGKLYDGNGVEPDVLVERPPEYYLQSGKDVILDKALELLIAKKGN